MPAKWVSWAVHLHPPFSVDYLMMLNLSSWEHTLSETFAVFPLESLVAGDIISLLAIV